MGAAFLASIQHEGEESVEADEEEACGVDMNGQERGWLLGYGAGMYLYIALSQLAPMSLLKAKGTKQQLANLSTWMFVLGMAAIGLPLLDHEHCSPATAAVAADGAAAAADHARDTSAARARRLG
jgi:hypothetical protein